ncbi:MAG: glycoside hydrolase family 3 N-terminal domain-containing protein [Antricoccus sp.]
MTPTQRVGQLIMVAMNTDPSEATQAINDAHVGGVFLLGGYPSAAEAASTIATAQAAAAKANPAGTKLLVALDQEGGAVRQIKGGVLDSLPDAQQQAAMTPADLETDVAKTAKVLADTGIDLDLAPVADVVPASIGAANAPIGAFNRQYGATAEQATPGVLAFMKGLATAGVSATLKHFPGLGRISNNTDTSDTGITDTVTTADDPSLATFKAGIDAGAQAVMVSSAYYPKIDPQNQAMFSPTVISTLLRNTLGFGGVVITDDVGAAKSVAAVPIADRATRFVEAGGDIVLTAVASDAVPMTGALLAKAQADPTFSTKVDAAVKRVLTLKDQHQLLLCSTKSGG